ncbi:MAG TPA: SsrA-binding protein SmpB [Candidatus Eremiobacteraeota bacterium]|nr:MAG: SsrA-binding protein [bacterium ADurb.Bin363]HPZ10319.1 SsrA-binding protein SmpB [Candidatus Eremiobacteraeota bacterium]
MADPVKIVATNRKARHLYEILESFEAGIVLKGSEVKSLREGKVSFVDSFARVHEGEVWLYNLHISPYEKGGYINHDPLRNRKLLFHKREIRKIQTETQVKGLTMIPLKIYFRKSYAKVEVGLGKGKKLFDRRESIAKRDAERRIERASKDRES